MSNKLVAIISVILFVVSTVVSTIRSSLIDLGSYVLTDPASESGHLMSMKESVLHNIVSSAWEGILAVVVFVFLVFIIRKSKMIIAELKKGRPKHVMYISEPGDAFTGNLASYRDENDVWLDKMFKENRKNNRE